MAKAKKEKTQVPAKTEEGELSVLEGEDIAEDELQADSGKGMENVGSGDIAIPFMRILQSNSPQCKRADPAYIKGAEEGMLYNTVTGDVYDPESTTVVAVPVAFERKLIEWRPRDEGGGIVGIYSADDPIQKTAERNDKNKDILPNGNSLVNTAQHYVLLVVDGRAMPCIMPFSATQLKYSRRWNFTMAEQRMTSSAGVSFRPPTFGFAYRVGTQAESNAENSWMSWKIEMLGQVKNRSLYDQAKKLSELISQGMARVDYSHLAGDGDGQTTEVDDRPSGTEGDHIPF